MNLAPPDGSPVRDAVHEGAGVAARPPVRRSALASVAMFFARAVVSILLIVAVIGGALAYRQHLVATKPASPRQQTPERARPIDVVSVTPAAMTPDLTLYGQIAAGRSVDLRMLVGGEVVKVSPQLVEGGRIANEEALVTVDAFEYEGALVRARAELAEAEARLKETEARILLEKAGRQRANEQERIAAREVERVGTLQDRGISSDAALDASRSRRSAAIAAVEARDNQVRVLEAQLIREQASLGRLRWNVQKAERDIRNTVLMAPYPGIVSNVAAEVGRLLNQNDRVATLVDMSRLEARFTVSDAQYGRLVTGGANLEGRKVDVHWRGGGQDLQVEGRIDRVSPVVASATGGFEVYARLIASPATAALRPGAFVTVAMPDIEYRDVVRLPQQALHPGNRIFSIGADDRLQQIDVVVAGFDGPAVLVRGPIPPASRIMASRLPDAGPGVLVRPR